MPRIKVRGKPSHRSETQLKSPDQRLMQHQRAMDNCDGGNPEGTDRGDGARGGMVPCTNAKTLRSCSHSGSCSQPQIRESVKGVVTQTTHLHEASLACIPAETIETTHQHEPFPHCCSVSTHQRSKSSNLPFAVVRNCLVLSV